jgi:hypothetical protein
MEDNNSRYTPREMLARAKEADTVIYTICLFPDPQTPEELAGPELLADIAQKTGGITFSVKDKGMQSLGPVMGENVLGYYPPQTLNPANIAKSRCSSCCPRECRRCVSTRGRDIMPRRIKS